MSPKRVSKTTKPAKPILSLDDIEIEAEAVRIHNESELIQKKLWSQRSYHSSYIVLEWDGIKEGFYKQRVRKLAAKNIKEKDEEKSKKNTKKRNTKTRSI